MVRQEKNACKMQFFSLPNGWLDEKSYGAAARNGWLALITNLNDNDEITEVCEGTNIQNSRDHYMNCKRIIGDLHGQAPLLGVLRLC